MGANGAIITHIHRHPKGPGQAVLRDDGGMEEGPQNNGKGSTEIRTQVNGIRIRCDNPYTIPPEVMLGILN